MWFKRSIGVSAACALASVIASGCSSSANSPPLDGGTKVTHLDAMVVVVTDDGGDDAGPLVYDGTSGKACKTDADCIGDSGVGINKCSNGLTFVVTNVKTQIVPTPICLVPLTTSGNCDPAPATDPNGQNLHFCDGPDAPTSPGICFALTNPPSSGMGACVPVCSFPLDGSAPTGCIGKNTCFPFTVGFDSNGAATGYGYCQGSCQSDGDCSALGTGYVCQTDIGACTKAAVKRTKQIGQACAADPSKTAGNDNATGACNCLPDTVSNDGYCTTACVVGGNACPAGWVCDNLLPNAIPSPDGTVLNVAKENVDTAGVCMPACTPGADGGVTPAGDSGSTDGGAGAPDGGSSEAGSMSMPPPACPGVSVCEDQTPSGPDCVP